MRRTLFYLTIALLTFGIGLLVVFNFYLKSENLIEETSQIIKIETPSSLTSAVKKDDSISKLFKPVEEICAETKCVGDGSIKPLIQKWLKGEKLKNEQTSLRTLKERQSMEEEAALPTLVDLNSDGKKELILKSECAPVGNCQFDVYTKKGKRYSSLLSTSMVQVFETLKTSTNGFKDLHLGTHGSASESDHRLMRFNGRKYIQEKCWNENYGMLDEKGEWHQLKKPIITRTTCNNNFEN